MVVTRRAPPRLWSSSAILVCILAATLAVARLLRGTYDQSFPYGPHEPPSQDTFFDGWYTRVTTSSNTSLAVVVGKYYQGIRQEPPENPPVICMVLVQPKSSLQDSQPPLRAHVRYFQDMITTQEGPASRDHAQSGAGSQQEATAKDPEDVDIQPFTVQTVGPALSGYDARGDQVSVIKNLSGREQQQEQQGKAGDGSFCKFSVDAKGVSLEAHIADSAHLKLHSLGDRSMVTPWSPTHTSPEGWVSELGPLIKLHYATLSLATPVSYELHLPAPETDNQPTNQGAGAASYSDSEELYEQGQPTTAPRPLAAGGAGLQQVMSGTGKAHMEAQYGRGFPPRWMWAQGHAVDPVTGVTTSFVLAGGDLPTAVTPPLPYPHLFLFSFRSGDLSVTMDPWNPQLPVGGVREVVDACAGFIQMEFGTLTHVIQVNISAAPSSYTPVACPTEAGFTTLSVEAFTATAHIALYERSLATAAAQAATASLTQARLLRPKAEQTGPMAAARLLTSVTLTGAALEFGGTYRCRDSNGEAFERAAAAA